MLHSIDCRLACNDDLDAVAQVWFESADQAFGRIIEMPSASDLRKRIDTELAGNRELWVARTAGEIVGMLALLPEEGKLDQLFVRPSMQQHGIGAALLRQAMARMPDGFTLRTMRENLAGRRFYEHVGLRLLSERLHPRTGHPVCYYRWTPLSDRCGSPVLSL